MITEVWWVYKNKDYLFLVTYEIEEGMEGCDILANGDPGYMDEPGEASISEITLSSDITQIFKEDVYKLLDAEDIIEELEEYLFDINTQSWNGTGYDEDEF